MKAKVDLFWHDLKIKTFYCINWIFNINNLLASIIINIIICLLLSLLFEPITKIDDYPMAIMLAGVYGKNESFMLYSNHLLGCVLATLYEFNSMIPWYYIAQYVTVVVSLSLILFILKKKNVMKNQWLILLIFVVSYNYYCRITFTKTAGIAIVAALLCALSIIEDELPKSYFFYTIVLFFVGSLWRVSTSLFLLICVIFFPCFIYVFLKKESLGYKVKRSLKFVLIVILLYVISNGLNSYNRVSMNNDATWKTFWVDNSIRAALNDYGWPPYDEFKDEYNKIGVSQNDYMMFCAYNNFSDRDVFTNELISEITKIRDDDKYEAGTIKIIYGKIKGYLKSFFGSYYSFLIIIVIAFKLLSGDAITIDILIMVSTIVAYSYMSYLGRVQPHVDSVVYTAALIICVYYKKMQNVINKKMIPLFVVLLVLMINSFYGKLTANRYQEGKTYPNELENDSWEESTSYVYKNLKLLSKDKEHLYILPIVDIWGMYQAFSIDDEIEKDFYSNIFYSANYIYPPAKAILKNYNINNIYKDSYCNEDVLFAFTDYSSVQIMCIEKYIQEHYWPDAKLVKTRDIEDLHIYKVVESE